MDRTAYIILSVEFILNGDSKKRCVGIIMKKPYPSSRDILEAVKEAAMRFYAIHPQDFPDIVLEILESKGFDVRHVTVKRIWRIYEKLVREGRMPDTLGVVEW